ncbi:MAG: DnaJ domain-containing protein [Alphaproteobacteria bacterium]
MPYLLLVLGLLLGIYTLYRFFINANVNQIKSLILSAVTITICLALFILAITGRLPAAIAIVAALGPFIAGFLVKRKQARRYHAQGQKQGQARQSSGPMDEEEALNILGLQKNASEEDIKAAYKKLMKKVHPDSEGSEWMAAKLNEAKDFLLRKK